MPAPSARSLIRGLTPPSERASLGLVRRAEERAGRRLARLERRLRRAALPASEGGPLRQLVAECLRLVPLLPEALRRRLLHGPDLRGFLSEAEIWTAVLERAREGRDPDRLFDEISRTEFLTALVPAGRLDRGFPARSRRLARARLRRLRGEMSALLLGLRLAHPGLGGGLLRFRLEALADPEQGRPANRIDLGAFGGPAGPLTIRLDGAPTAPSRGPRAVSIEAILTPRSLLLREPGRRGGTAFPLGALGLGGPLPAGSAPRPAFRALVPGTPIVLAPAVISTARALRVRREAPGVAGRLARGLRLVSLAWPDAAREIVRRTALVVPVDERRLVSYSLAARPGVSFINVRGKRTVDLADDLLHETAHHLLHEAQEEVDFLVRGPDTEETQAFDSPWRRARRPLHGILHGAFTFLFRAELFGRILRARRRLPGVIDPLLGRGGARFVERERRRELGMMARALRDLRTARRAGLLTPAGRTLVAGLAAWHRRLLTGGTR